MRKISIFHPDSSSLNELVVSFQNLFPNHQVFPWKASDPADYLICWSPCKDILKTPQLKVLFALGAGVDAFLSLSYLPDDLLVVRLEGAGMEKQMLEIALYATLNYSRKMDCYRIAEQQKKWQKEIDCSAPFSLDIGVMGLGKLGGFVASQLSRVGYSVSGYSYHPKTISGVDCYDKDQLDLFLSKSRILINLLPLTNETRGILNLSLFQRLPVNSYLINLARGAHLIENDLLKAIDLGLLSGAFLDVFETEPLVATHVFWQHPKITVTPHIAAKTMLDQAVGQIANNIVNFENQKPMRGVVNRRIGY